MYLFYVFNKMHVLYSENVVAVLQWSVLLICYTYIHLQTYEVIYFCCSAARWLHFNKSVIQRDTEGKHK